MAGRDEITRTMPQLRAKYPTYASYGASRVEDIFAASGLRQATVLQATVFASSVGLNDGKGHFDVRPLPVEAQFAPVYAVIADDFDNDGKVDLLLGGNFYGVPPVLGRYDASHGLLLRGDGSGRFSSVDSEKSGLWIDGQVRDMKWLRRADGERVIAVARNNDSLQILRPTERTR
jgi:hypothetical protein